MATARRLLAATAMFAGLAVSAASTAWADTPTMDGSYNAVMTGPTGKKFTTPWTVNACGDGCLRITAGLGWSQAHLVDGQWVLDTMDNVSCSDGSRSLYGANAHLTWDPNTLAGTAEHTYITGACGRPPGYSQTDQLEIKQASS
jgi:hypothetical protein